MNRLPLITFIVTLTVIAALTFWHYQDTSSLNAQKDQQLQQVSTALKTAKAHAQTNNVRLQQLKVAPARSQAAAEAPGQQSPEQRLHSKSPGVSSTQEESGSTSAATTATDIAAATIKAVQDDNQKISQVSAPTAAPASTGASSRFVVLCILTLFGCMLSTFFLVAKRFGAAKKQIASATLGTILGYWFSSAS